MTSAEAWAVGAAAIPAAAIVAAYLLDMAGLPFAPWFMLPLVLVAAAVAWRAMRRRARATPIETGIAAAIAGTLSIWIGWLAWPTLLPLSTGPDLTHHLILIRYIEEHWRLVHDPSLERFLGEMTQYTPGSHILVALVGAWSGTDGLRVLHPVQAVVVGLKAAFLWLIAVRLLRPRTPRVIALASVCLLFGAPRYLLGGFTEYGFVAQVIAELFAIVMWWSVVVWDQEPGWRPCVVFTVAGAAGFLTWPVYTGAPVLALLIVLAMRVDIPVRTRIRHVAVATVPFGLVAVVYLAGRLGWLQLAGTGGAAPSPSIAAFGLPLVSLALLGLFVSLVDRRARATVLFAASVVLQAAAFFVIARRAHAPQPYMTLKMFYLLLWPMAALATSALAALWDLASRQMPIARAAQAAAAIVVAGVFALAIRPIVASAHQLHPRPPATSLPLYEAGRWARANLPAACVEYLVGDDETAYWLHLAVLGNPRMSARTGDNSTYEPNDAIVRWLTPGGLPYAIADLPALPRGVRDDLDIVRQFGTAAIARRRGAASC